MKLSKFEEQIFKAYSKLNETIKYVKENANKMSADEIEREIFKRCMGIGKEIEDKEGKKYKRHDKVTREYFSIFGKIKVERTRYWRKGESLIIALDSQCNLPKRSYSYYLQDIMNSLSITGTFTGAKEKMKKFFNLDIYERAYEDLSQESISEYERYYEEKTVPEEKAEGEIQVLSFDGKGVPMIKKEAAKIKGRQGKGEKRQKKKEALVGTSYTVDKKLRTAKEIAINLIYPERKEEIENKKREYPRAKNILGIHPFGRRMASLRKAKQEVIEEMGNDAMRRNKGNKRPTVVLLDGMPYLYKLVKKGLNEIKEYEVILDIIHVVEYLYLASHSIYKENSNESRKYVYNQLLSILEGKVGRVIGGMKQIITKRKLTGSQEKAINKAITYLTNHKRFMKYDEYLSKGYPIGTGVVESACKQVVKSRMEGSGMRWSLDGAEGMLLLRSIEKSNDWDSYNDFRISQQKLKLYENRTVKQEYLRAA